MTQRADISPSAAQPNAPSRKTDLLGLSLVAIIIVTMTAWIGVLVWAAIAFLNWLVS